MSIALSSRAILRGVMLILVGSIVALVGSRELTAYLRSMIFLPDGQPLGPVTVDGVAFETLDLHGPDGSTIRGLAAPCRAAEATVLYFHGNGGSAAKAASETSGLARAGYDVVLAEYRGYGGNPGEPSEAGLVKDAFVFLDEARRRAAGRKLFLVGHSLGGALAVLVAADARIDGLATFGAVASVSDLVPPIGRPFLRDGFDALSASVRVVAPWIISHGALDDVVPASDALRLAGPRPRPDRELDIVAGHGHAVDPAMLVGLVERLATLSARP